MPVSAPRPCSAQGCRVLAVKAGRCAEHQREAWAKRADATKRVTGRKLQAMRRALFLRNPLCVECERHGLVELATQRDHITPLCDGGEDTEANTQGLCDACHEKKSLSERSRGRGRFGVSVRLFGDLIAGVGVGQKSRAAPPETDGSLGIYGE